MGAWNPGVHCSVLCLCSSQTEVVHGWAVSHQPQEGILSWRLLMGVIFIVMSTTKGIEKWSSSSTIPRASLSLCSVTLWKWLCKHLWGFAKAAAFALFNVFMYAFDSWLSHNG